MTPILPLNDVIIEKNKHFSSLDKYIKWYLNRQDLRRAFAQSNLKWPKISIGSYIAPNLPLNDVIIENNNIFFYLKQVCQVILQSTAYEKDIKKTT